MSAEPLPGSNGKIPISAHDEDPYIKDELNWINVPLTEQKPLLGICLGQARIHTSLTMAA